MSAPLIDPEGHVEARQDLVLIEKGAAGKVARRELLPVLFVPLTGDH